MQQNFNILSENVIQINVYFEFNKNLFIIYYIKTRKQISIMLVIILTLTMLSAIIKTLV